jgi:hypothetical protein
LWLDDVSGTWTKEGETQCSFHHQGKSSLVNSAQLTVADVENRAHREDSVGAEKIEKMTGDGGVPRNRSRMVIRHCFGLGLGPTRRQGFLSLSILCSWADCPSGAEAGDGGSRGAAGDSGRC